MSGKKKFERGSDKFQLHVKSNPQPALQTPKDKNDFNSFKQLLGKTHK